MTDKLCKIMTEGTRLLTEYENDINIVLAYSDKIVDGVRRGYYKTYSDMPLVDNALSKVKNSGLCAFVLSHVDLAGKSGRA
jgi:hypothetical protein